MRRLRKTLAWICTGALLAAAPAAAEPIFVTPQGPQLGPVDLPPVTTQTPPTVRVLQLGKIVDADAVRSLADAVRASRVIALVPAGAELDVQAQELVVLEEAGARANLDVVVQPDGNEDGTAVAALAALAAREHRLGGAPCEAPCVDDALDALGLTGAEPTSDGGAETVRSAIVAPVPDAGGVSLPTAVLAAVLLALAAILTAVLVSRLRPRPTVTTEHEPPPTPLLPAAPPAGASTRAQVVSVLEPEGYVEVDRCLRRAAWADDGPSPNPGDWVELHHRNGRLWAYGPKSRTRSRASA